MIALASLLARGTPKAQDLAQHPQPEAALRLLSGQRPTRLASADTLLDWAAQASATPPPLLQACLKVTPDKAETAALLLPPAQGTPPSLSQTLAALEAAALLPLDQRRAVWLALALSLPPEARLLLNRLAAGTFRQKLKPEPPPQGAPRTFLALLTMIAPQGPEASFALRQDNGLVPIARLPLTLPETPEILAWARAHVTDRFGPNLAVSPDLVFTLSCQGTTPNPRRKSGLDLVAPRLLAWSRDVPPDQATTLETFRLPRAPSSPRSFSSNIPQGVRGV